MAFSLAHCYAQTDPRWADIKLGDSVPADGTIGNCGCVVTAFCNLHNALFGTDIQPPTMNTLFSTHGVFIQDPEGYSIVVWANVPKALPMLKFVARDYNYWNPTVWAWLNLMPKTPVIVQCHPSTQYPEHFIVFIGGQKMIDSLDGMVKPTSTYPVLTGSVRYTRA